MEKFSLVVISLMLLIVSTFLFADSSKIIFDKTGHKYQRIDKVVTWHEARNYCASLGGYLATITSSEEDSFIYASIGNTGTDIWLGGHDSVVEGSWKWVTDEKWSYSNWASGEPNNNQGKQHYLQYWSSTPNQWDDDFSSDSASFICEWSEQPLATRALSPKKTNTPFYIWNAISNSSWYYLWVNDSSGNKIKKWYTATQAGCPNGTGICFVKPNTSLANGSAVWWVRTWNDFGYGFWNKATYFNVSN